MLSLGIDVGSTTTHGVVLDESQVVEEYAIPTRRGDEGVTAVLLDVARTLASKMGITPKDFGAVGVGIPGVVNRETGEITRAVNLRIDYMPLRSRVADEFSVPVRLDNDVKATVVAVGQRLGSDSVTFVNFGTGVAAATLVGQVIRGRRNLAGEIGHIVLNPNGDPCRCGQRGCIETTIGGSYVAPRMEMLELDWTTLNTSIEPAGKAAFDQAVRAFSRVAAIVALAYAPDHIVFGGGVVNAAPWILPEVKKFLIDRAQIATFPDYEEIAGQLSVLDPDFPAAAIGAALVGQDWAEGHRP